MKKTLFEIVHATEHSTEIEKAISASYEAGKSAMRGIITEQIKIRFDTLPDQRYWRIAQNAAEHICLGINGINANYLGGRGDSGSGEAAEFLGWGFEVTE